MKPGLYFDISFESYVKIPAINNSILKILTDQSPAHCKYYIDHGRESTKALAFGSAADCYILEPTLFAKKYVTGPDARRNSKEWKEFAATVPEGMEILKPDDMADIISIYNKISGSHAMRLLEGGVSQVVAIWIDEITGLKCKSRMDYLNESIPMITDLKTTKSANPELFAKDIYKYKYYQQAAFYIDGYIAATKCEHDCCFAFFAVEKTGPFVHSALELGPKSIEAGRISYRKAIDEYAKCLKEDKWPQYLEQISMIEMPKWALEFAGLGQHNLM